jgi:ribonuclease D
MERTISKAEINEKPLIEYEGNLTVVDTDELLDKVLPAVQAETLLGFDTETRPAFRKGESYLPSLLQLGGESHVWIFHLKKVKQLDALFSVLADPDILKVGVAIDRDILELRDLHEFTAAGFRDVGKMAEQRHFRKTGLRPLAAMLLNGRVSKGAQVSNWASYPLSEKQILYAATDAWISRRLYEALLKIRP